MTTPIARRIVWVWVVLASSTGLQAQDDEDLAATRLQEVIDASVEWFELSGGPEAQPLRPVTVLRWDNNSRGSATGLTVIYVGGGRPEAVCCIYPWEQSLVHEFGSLSRGPLTGSRDGTRFWEPSAAGVAFQPVPEAAAPADSAVARLRQMKALVRRFEATLVGWNRDDSDRQELRLLPRPLYRYEEPSGDIVDGALFAFSMGTDPEVLLLLEAVRTDESMQWEYAFARRTSGELEGRLDGKVVWSADRYPETKDPRRADRGVATPLDQLLGAEAAAELR